MGQTSDQHSAPALSRVGTAFAALALAIFLGNVVLAVFDVAMRWVFRDPQSWVADIAQLSFPVAVACSFPAALESGHMIAIRFLGERIGPRATWALDTLGQLCMALLLSLFTWKMFVRAFSDWATGYKTSAIALPVAPTWLIVAVLLCICALIQFRRTWRTCARR
ncbi:MAG: TRAP transporter small permease [Burkholderiales bacterium]